MKYIVLSLILISPAAYAQITEYDVTGTVTSEVFSGTPVPPVNDIGFLGNGVGSKVSGTFYVNSFGQVFGGFVPLNRDSSFSQSPFSVSVTGFDTNYPYLTDSWAISNSTLQTSESENYSIIQGPNAGYYAYTFLTTVGDLIVTELTPNGPVTVVGAPEMDPANAASGLTLFCGMLLVLRSRTNVPRVATG